MAPERVLVVGGGIGGLSTTIAMRKAGVAIDVVELNPKWDVYGVGIIQPGNAIRGLSRSRDRASATARGTSSAPYRRRHSSATGTRG